MGKKRKKKVKKTKDKQALFKEEKPQRPEKKSIFSRISTYFKEVRVELKKVVWPGRKEIVASAIVVIVMVIIFVLIIGGLDFLFSQMVKLVTTSFK